MLWKCTPVCGAFAGFWSRRYGVQAHQGSTLALGCFRYVLDLGDLGGQSQIANLQILEAEGDATTGGAGGLDEVESVTVASHDGDVTLGEEISQV